MNQFFASGGQSISFSFSISPSNEHPGLISFRMDWLDLLAVQGTLKSLLQHHTSKASILQHSAFFTVQLSHPYMTPGKIIALTRQTFVGKVMSLLFNMLSRLVITFLPRSKRLLISWLQSPSAVILEPPKIKSGTYIHIRPLSWQVTISVLCSSEQYKYNLFSHGAYIIAGEKNFRQVVLSILRRFDHDRLYETVDLARQAPPSLGFSRQEHWSGLPFPSPMLAVC